MSTVEIFTQMALMDGFTCNLVVSEVDMMSVVSVCNFQLNSGFRAKTEGCS